MMTEAKRKYSTCNGDKSRFLRSLEIGFRAPNKTNSGRDFFQPSLILIEKKR